MPRLANGKLSHVPNKGFRASVGYYLKNGKRTPKVFWLGHDRVTAYYYADQARGAWQSLTLDGGTVWTDEELRGLKDAVAYFKQVRMAIFAKHARDRQNLAREGEYLQAMFGPSPTLATPVATPADVEPPAHPKLYATLDAYRTAMKAKALSGSYKQRCRMRRDSEDVPAGRGPGGG